ncbi:wax ester/triacylglycerol synthase domain-containing protein [Gordonia sp. (in: high G+C Gram-positive bacteria)]|uniref:wax ester/triacylglycerol synthase domain-containing protein n=1 Tax=Gordonia sp. (in: high G+C Gram-positive bacteria) TaxID=84139 RepID=UPI003C737CCD
MERVAPVDLLMAFDRSAAQQSTMMFVDLVRETDVPSADLVTWFADRIARAPAARDRIVLSYLGIGDAYWSDTPDFVARDRIHLHRAATMTELLTVLTDLLTNPFDIRGALMEVHLIRGIEGVEGITGRCFAVVTKVHHSLGEPLYLMPTAASWYSADLTPEVRRQPVSRLRATLRELPRIPLRPFFVTADMIKMLRAHKRLRATFRAEGLAGAIFDRTAITQPLGPSTVLGVIACPIADLYPIAVAKGVSINDLLMAAIGTAIADCSGVHDRDIVSAFAVSLRDDRPATARNLVTGGLVNLATTRPLSERLGPIHDGVRHARRILRTEGMVPQMPRLPAFVYSLLERRRRRHPIDTPLTVADTRVSSVPRPDSAGWQVCGSPVIGRFGVTAPGGGCGICHIVTSLGETIWITVTADPDQVTDLPGYLDRLRTAVAELQTLRDS